MADTMDLPKYHIIFSKSTIAHLSAPVRVYYESSEGGEDAFDDDRCERIGQFAMLIASMLGDYKSRNGSDLTGDFKETSLRANLLHQGEAADLGSVRYLESRSAVLLFDAVMHTQNTQDVFKTLDAPTCPGTCHIFFTINNDSNSDSSDPSYTAVATYTPNSDPQKSELLDCTWLGQGPFASPNVAPSDLEEGVRRVREIADTVASQTGLGITIGSVRGYSSVDDIESDLSKMAGDRTLLSSRTDGVQAIDAPLTASDDG